MLAGNNEIVSENIFTRAGELAFIEKYEERTSTQVYNKCDRLVVLHDKRVFWFTTESELEHTKELLN